MGAISPAEEPQKKPITPFASLAGGVIHRFLALKGESSLALLIRLSLLWTACRAGRLQAGIEEIHRQRPLLCVWIASPTKACRGTLKSVVDNVVAAPLAVSR